jgi:hypothetical protein
VVGGIGWVGGRCRAARWWEGGRCGAAQWCEGNGGGGGAVRVSGGRLGACR